jgi:hypothetical protein
VRAPEPVAQLGAVPAFTATHARGDAAAGLRVQFDRQHRIGQIDHVAGQESLRVLARVGRGKTVAQSGRDPFIVGMAQQSLQIIGAPAAQDQTLALQAQAVPARRAVVGVKMGDAVHAKLAWCGTRAQCAATCAGRDPGQAFVAALAGGLSR